MTIDTLDDAFRADLPHDVELEQALLGKMILSPECIPSVRTKCDHEDFVCAPHGRIASVIFDLNARNVSVTPLSLMAVMKQDEWADELKGHAYLANMALAAPTDSPVAMAKALRETRQRRDAVIATEETHAGLQDNATRIADAFLPTLAVIDASMQLARQSAAEEQSDAMETLLQDLQDRLDGKSVPHISTGLNSLDAVIGGLQAGDLAVYCGRPGMGKTSLLTTTALAAATAGHPVEFFSLEMTRQSLWQRIGCDLDALASPKDAMSYSWFRNGTFRANQLERLHLALRSLSRNFTIYDNGSLTIHEIAALAAARAAKAQKMGLVIIDYLQKIPAADRYKGNRVQEVTEISNAAKALALRLGWPVLVGAQLNRAVEARGERHPTLADLRESGAIEQDADQVVGLYRPGYYLEKRKPQVHEPKYAEWETDFLKVKHRLDLHVLKNRHGGEDIVEVHCDLRSCSVRDKP